jgi:cell division protein ZapA
MARITVEINSRQYEMACEDGEEEHLHSLAATLDGQVTEMQSNFGQIGDLRLMVMAALTVVDKLEDTQHTVEALKDEIEGLRETRAAEIELNRSNEDQFATMLEATAERIEVLASRIHT